MSVEKITSKILEDAKAQADAITGDAKLRADGIIRDAREKADKLIEDYRARGEEEKCKLIDRKKSVAEIDGRKLTLEVKQKIIRNTFTLASEKIAAMDKDKYIEFLIGKIQKSGIADGAIVMNKEQREKIGPELVDELNRRISGVKDGGFTLSDETRNMVGGFMVKRGQVYMNGTLENLMEEEQGEIMPSVVEKLF